MEEIFKNYPLLKNQNVPRETLIEFDLFISMLQEENEKINIISKETAKNEVIRERHIIDSAQIIEFVDLNSNIVTDIGSGGGMPGIIISIMIKNQKNLNLRFQEIEYVRRWELTQRFPRSTVDSHIGTEQ